MAWFLVEYGGSASSAGHVVRADEARSGELGVVLLRGGRTVFQAPASWVERVQDFPDQKQARAALRQLEQRRHRYRSAHAVQSETVVVRPDGRPASGGGFVEGGGVRVRVVAPRRGAAPTGAPPVSDAE